MEHLYKEVDNIKIYNPEISNEHEDFNAKHLDSLHEAENSLFWSIVRKEYILEKFKSYIDKNASIIEVGAGTGDVSRFILENGYSNIAVGEMHLSGLRYAQTYGIKECYQFDLLQAPFENKFDAVCMFDVLEHISEDELALQQTFKMLKEGGKIVLTVPSHMWLWNRSDAINAHKRRYTKRELTDKLKAAGFKILEIKYFFIFITPLLLIRALIDKDNGTEVQDSESLHLDLNPFINKVLLALSRFENKISKFIPNLFGGSLFVIAIKLEEVDGE